MRFLQLILVENLFILIIVNKTKLPLLCMYTETLHFITVLMFQTEDIYKKINFIVYFIL